MPQKDLNILLASMQPELHGNQFVFCTVSEAHLEKLALKPLGLFREKEGVTLIITKEEALDSQLEYADLWALITCNIHSDLNAVGFLAAMSTALADCGIAVNAISAYYHDHLFVPASKAQQAMTLLKQLTN